MCWKYSKGALFIFPCLCRAWGTSSWMPWTGSIRRSWSSSQSSRSDLTRARCYTITMPLQLCLFGWYVTQCVCCAIFPVWGIYMHEIVLEYVWVHVYVCVCLFVCVVRIVLSVICFVPTNLIVCNVECRVHWEKLPAFPPPPPTLISTYSYCD